MFSAGVAACLTLSLAQANERALFINTAVTPTALAAITDNEPLAGLPQQRTVPTAFVFRQRNAFGSPAAQPGTGPVPPILLALAEPNGLTPLSDLRSDTGNGPGLPPGQPGFQGSPLAGSAPNGAGAAAPVETVPAVPEPATWLTMILGFFIVGSAMRRGRRPASIQLESIADKTN